MKENSFNFRLTEDMIARPPYRPLTDEEVASRMAWFQEFNAAMRKLNETEPLPDNFLDLCKGRTTVPVYSTK